MKRTTLFLGAGACFWPPACTEQTPHAKPEPTPAPGQAGPARTVLPTQDQSLNARPGRCASGHGWRATSWES